MIVRPFLYILSGMVAPVSDARVLTTPPDDEFLPLNVVFRLGFNWCDVIFATALLWSVFNPWSSLGWIIAFGSLALSLWVRGHRTALHIDADNVIAHILRPLRRPLVISQPKSDFVSIGYESRNDSVWRFRVEKLWAPRRHLLVLRHAQDRDKDVLLHSGYGRDDLEAWLTTWTRALGLPAEDVNNPRIDVRSKRKFRGIPKVQAPPTNPLPLAEHPVPDEIDWQHPPAGLQITATDTRITIRQTVGLPRLGLYRLVAAILLAPFSALGFIATREAAVVIVFTIVGTIVLTMLRGHLPLPASHKMTLYRGRGLLLRYDRLFWITWRWIGWKNLMAVEPSYDHLNIRRRRGAYLFGTALTPQQMAWLDGYLKMAIKD